MLFLKQSTAVEIQVGPVVDAGDGFTPETGLAAGTVDALGVYKAGGNTLVDTSGNTDALTHVDEGVYTAALTASNTDTPGSLVFVLVDTSVCRPVRLEFMVLPANVYDSLIGGTDLLDANMTQVAGSSTKADNVGYGAAALVVGATVTGTLAVGSMTTDLSEATDDHFNGRTVIFLGGALDGQRAEISDYTGATKLITFANNLTESPSVGQSFVIA